MKMEGSTCSSLPNFLVSEEHNKELLVSEVGFVWKFWKKSFRRKLRQLAIATSGFLSSTFEPLPTRRKENSEPEEILFRGFNLQLMVRITMFTLTGFRFELDPFH